MSLEQMELVSPSKTPTPQTDDRTYRKLGWIILALFVAIFGVWGSLAPLSSAVSAPGKVIVASNNRIIQHLEGGIVKEILVKDGDSVTKNAPLIHLETTQAKAQLEMAQAQYFEALALESRLLAERDGAANIVFSEELSQMENGQVHSMIIEGQRREFFARRQQLADEKIVLEQRIVQLKSQIVGLEAIITSKSSLSASYGEEVAEWEVLYKQQLIDKMRLRDIKREKVRMDGDIANAKAEIARAKGQISEVNAQIIAQKQTFLKDVVAEIRDVQTALADLRARIAALQDTLKRTDILAPVSGTVTNLAIHTVGGVIPPGQPILEIVPQGEPLVVEGKVAASEVTNVRVGLEAEIRFPNFAHVKSLDIVKGAVIFVAPDAILEEQTQVLYYPVKVRVTPEGEKELIKNHLTIQAGMPTDTMIVVSSRTFMDYMIKPFKAMFTKAFNEE